MNSNIKQVRNLFTYRIPLIKLAVKELRSTKFYAILLVSVMIAGIFSLSPAISTLTNDVIIRSTGRIFAYVTANSGSSEDIQAAVDEVAAMGVGNVYIPEGTFNFAEIGESWQTVNIPAGVNLFGASTDRDANDQVVEWKTILVMPFDAMPSGPPDKSWFFNIQGNMDPNKPSRLSDIKLVGYREFDHTNPNWHGGILVNSVIDFRIDHCSFKHCTGGGVAIGTEANGACCGVIDHCRFVNDYGVVVPSWLDCTVCYGVTVFSSGIGSTRWEDDVDKVLGHYLEYTVFIEDCYFSRWRHCVSSNDGAHYVFRHNTIEHDAGFGSLDGHGTYNHVGTRCMEIYDNMIVDPVDCSYYNSNNSKRGLAGVFWRGGGGVVFNNHVRYYYRFVQLTDEGSVEKCWPHDIWIWNNNMEDTTLVEGTSSAQQGVDYFLYEKPGYAPYPYPHPLTLETYP